MRLGELMKQRRTTADMSLQDVADAVGLTKGYVWEIEQGKTINIGILSAIRISVALGIPINLIASSALESMETPHE